MEIFWIHKKAGKNNIFWNLRNCSIQIINSYYWCFKFVNVYFRYVFNLFVRSLYSFSSLVVFSFGSQPGSVPSLECSPLPYQSRRYSDGQRLYVDAWRLIPFSRSPLPLSLGWFEDWSPNCSGVLGSKFFRALALPDSVGVAQDVLLSACCSWGRDSQSRRGSQGEDDWHRRPNTCRKGGNILFLKFYPSFATIRALVPHFRPAWRWLRCFKYPRRSVKPCTSHTRWRAGKEDEGNRSSKSPGPEDQV